MGHPNHSSSRINRSNRPFLVVYKAVVYLKVNGNCNSMNHDWHAKAYSAPEAAQSLFTHSTSAVRPLKSAEVDGSE